MPEPQTDAMKTFALTGGLDGLDGPPCACASADDRIDVFATGSGNTVWRWSWDGTTWAPAVGMPALGKIPAEGVCAVSSGPGRVEVFAADVDNHTPLWWRGDHGNWLPGPKLPFGANLPAESTAAAVCASPDDIDVFAAGANNTPWWWHWNGVAWFVMGPLPGAANLPAEPIAAVSPAPGRLDVFAAGAGNHLWHWWRTKANQRWFLEDFGGNLPAGGVSAVSWGPNRMDVFAASGDPGNPLWHWWWDGGHLGSESLGGSLAPGAVSAVSSAANRLDVFGIAPNQRLAHWSWDGEHWAGPEYHGDNLPAGNVSAVVRKPDQLDVFVVGAGNTLRKWPARGLEGATTQLWQNWPTNQTVDFAAGHVAGHLWPESLEELVGIVREAGQLGQGARAVGSSWSNSDVAVSPAYVVETNKLNRVLTNVLDTSLNAHGSTLQLVHVEAGIKLDDLNSYLDGKNLALSTMGGSSGQTLAGALSTSAHGMDIDRGPIPDMVQAIHLVGPGGVQHWIEPNNGITTRDGVKNALGLPDENIHYDDHWFNSVLVSMGSMGIIYSLVVEVVPQYDLVDTREALDWSAMKARLKGGSPNPFDRNRGVQVVIDIYPHGDGSRTCYLTTRKESRPPTVKVVGSNSRPVLEFITPGMLNTWQLDKSTVDETLWFLTSLQQKIPPDGPGWGHTIMGGPDAGPIRGLTVEVVFNASNTTYLDFIDSVLQILYNAYYVAHTLTYLGWISLRFQGRSRAYLSPQSMAERTCTVEFAAVYRVPERDIGWSDTPTLLALIEAEGRRFGGIQHWGMNDGINASDVARAYPCLDTWRRVRWQLTNGGTITTFDNDFTRRCGLSNPPSHASANGESLAGVLTSGPAVSSWTSGRLDVFAKGTDDALWHKWYDNTWSDWERLDGVLRSDPAAVSWGNGRIDVFARGTDDALCHKWYDNAWSGWESLAGVLTSGPAVSSWTSGRLDVFAKGIDDALWHKWYDNNAWSDWESLGGELRSDPAAVSWGSGRIDVFAKGIDNALWHKWYDNAWSGWESLAGVLTSGPAVSSWASGRLDVFANGIDDTLWHKWYDNNTWSDWESLGGELRSDPDAVSWDKGRIDVFANGIDDALWHKWYDQQWEP